MSTPNKFAVLPTSGSVAAGVTLLASAWFALAGAAILNEPVAGLRDVQARVTVTSVSQPQPEARETIHVVASRSELLAPEARETIHVVASRSQAPVAEEPEAFETIRVVARRLPGQSAVAL